MMKSIVPNTTLNIVVNSRSYSAEKDVKEGEICKHKIKPESIVIFQDVYGEYGYEKTIKVLIDASDFDELSNHIKKIRDVEFEDEYEEELPF